MKCPLRGPATGARLEQLGQPEIYKNGRGIKSDTERMRKAYKTHAKANGDSINAMNRHQYKRAVRNQFFAEKSARAKEYQQNKLHSINAEKAARVQAFRDAWARTKS